MKKNRIKINVPGKFNEDTNPNGMINQICTNDQTCTNDHNTADDNHLEGITPTVPAVISPTPMVESNEMLAMNMQYPTGFINNQDYTENYSQDWNVTTEPRLLNPMNYSPIIYTVNQINSKETVSNSNDYQYYNPQIPSKPIKTNNSNNKSNKKSLNIRLPYMFVNKDDVANIGFGIQQNKLHWYNYWITTEDSARVTASVVQMFGRENVYITKSFFFKKNNSYDGERVILITQIPQRPYKFINKLNRKMSFDKRTVKSVNGDYLISRDCIFIIISNYSVDYICSNYYKYHKNEGEQIQTLMKSLKRKFTYMDIKDICD